MSEREVFELNDDGEPPSKSDENVELFDDSEHLALIALTTDAEMLINQSGLLHGNEHIDNDVIVVKDHARLRRRTSMWFDQDTEGNKIPVLSHAYFYSERLPNGMPYVRSWDDSSRTIHWNADDQILDSASSVHERLLNAFSEDVKPRMGRIVLKGIIQRIILKVAR